MLGLKFGVISCDFALCYFIQYCIVLILCSVIQIMDMRNILGKRASKVGYGINLYLLF